MDRQNRRELLEVIEQQKEQLGRYEARLKDVVRAYKGLSKEKETLESTLKAITAATQDDMESRDHPPDGGESDVESVADSQVSVDSSSYRSRLGAISASLASLSQEKSMNEAKFVAERKRFKKEKEDLAAQINTLKSSEENLRRSVEDVKSKLIVEKYEREQETNNNRLMMKELQKLLAEERNSKEKISEELVAQKSEGTVLKAQLNTSMEESRLEGLQSELEEVKLQLGKSEEQLSEQNTTKQHLRQLQQELLEVRQQHQDQLRSAELARESAELRAMEIQQQQEHRVGNLESRLQELSSSLAEYQRLRELDQTDINRLRTKIDSLSDENSALVRAVSLDPPSAEEETTEEEAMLPEQIINKVLQFKKVLMEKNVGADVLEPVFSLPLHLELRDKLEQLRQRVEQLQKDSGSQARYEEFVANSAQATQLVNCKAENDALKSKVSDGKREILRLNEDLREKALKLLELKQQAENDKEVLRMENRKQVGVLKYELQQQRERSLALLEEKDGEITRLMGELEKTVEEAFFSPDRGRNSSPMVLPSRKVSCDIGDMNAGASSSGAPLHYVQELSRKEIEIKELRVLSFQTETTLRELQLNMSTKEEKYQERIEDLEHTIERLKRMTTTEGANLEYLKNVVLNYMLSTDVANRNHMLKAIGAVLTFRKSEIEMVMDHNTRWWWRQQQQPQQNNKKK